LRRRVDDRHDIIVLLVVEVIERSAVKEIGFVLDIVDDIG